MKPRNHQIEQKIIAEQRRLESISRRQQQESKRKLIISKSIASSQSVPSKHIKFECDSSDEEIHVVQSSRCLENPTSSALVEEDSRFKRNKFFEDDQVEKGRDNEIHSKFGTVQRPAYAPFRRYDPSNPEHVEWIRKLNSSNENGKERTDDACKERIKEDGPSPSVPSISTKNQSVVEPKFAKELRKKLKGKTTDEKPFSFLAMLGRDTNAGDAMEGNKNTSALNGEKVAKDVDLEMADEGSRVDARDEQATICLYKEPEDGQKHECYFFIDEHSTEIQGLVASFRRHLSEEKLRKNWPKQRDAMVKFYKHERKLALKNMRAMNQQPGLQNGRSKGRTIGSNGKK